MYRIAGKKTKEGTSRETQQQMQTRRDQRTIKVLRIKRWQQLILEISWFFTSMILWRKLFDTKMHWDGKSAGLWAGLTFYRVDIWLNSCSWSLESYFTSFTVQNTHMIVQFCLIIHLYLLYYLYALDDSQPGVGFYLYSKSIKSDQM